MLSSSRSRQLHLDGIRGLAILAVVCWHVVSSPLGFETITADGRFPVGPLAFAWAGVDVFFALSGFLITGILLQAQHATNYFQVFFWRRACRLLPLYFLAILSYFAARKIWAADPILGQYLQKSGVPDWTLLLGVQNLWMGAKTSFGPGWLAVTWSLAVEWQFYMLWAITIRYLSRSALWTVTLIGLIATPIIRGYLDPVLGYVTLLGRADAFLAGAVVVLILRQPTLNRYCLKAPRFLGGIFGLACLVLMTMLYFPEEFGAITPWYGTGTHSVIALTSGLAILYLSIHPAGWLGRLMRLTPLVGLGTISYGIYLMHQPVRFLCFRFLRGSAPSTADAQAIWLSLLVVVLTFFLALIVYATLERAFIALGRRFDYRLIDAEALNTNITPALLATEATPRQ